MKNKRAGRWLLLLTLLAITILAALLYAPNTAAEAEKKPQGIVSTTSTEIVEPVAVESPKPEIPKILLDIAWCESKGDQSRIGYNYRLNTITDPDTGATSTVKVLWSRDIGRFQINEYYHAARAKSLGMDIYSEAGNTAYALVLYNDNGTRDWLASRECWKNIEAWKAKHQSYY